MNRTIVAVLLLSSLTAVAQNKPSPIVKPDVAVTASPASAPVVLKREIAGVPPADKYPFAALSQALQTPASSLPSINAVTSPASPQAPDGAEVPPSYVGQKDVALSATANDALNLSKKLASEHNSPVPSTDGRIVYTYGIGLPTVICAPFHVCTLELQPGEKLAGEPQLGDSVRWEVNPSLSGSADFAVPVLIIKPKFAGLDTTMVITTDRRTYYVRLISKSEEYVARTAFAYTDDEHLQWKMFLAEQDKQKKAQLALEHVAYVSNDAVEKLYFNYEIKGKGPVSMKPVRVMDDGRKSYIEMPEAAQHRELPALVIIGPSGNEMVNYRVRGGEGQGNTTYVIDRLFDKAALVVGSGKHQQVFTILRKEPQSRLLSQVRTED
jgi:P-type conjugative transfer protein TrbG